MAEFAGFPSTAAAGTFDRRRFLDALLAVGFVSTAVAMAYPVARYLVPPRSGEAGDERRRRESRGAQAEQRRHLSSSAASRASSSGRPMARCARSARCARTSIARCSSKADTSQLWCACHNGMYDLGGNVVSGPPPRGLERFVVNLRGEPGDEEIVVSRKA